MGRMGWRFRGGVVGIQRETVVAQFESLLRLLRARSAASLIVQNLELPADVAAGILDARGSPSQSEIIRFINRTLNEEALKHEGVFVLDYDGLVSRHGRLHWTDERKWLASRAPVSSACLIHLAKEYLKFI